VMDASQSPVGEPLRRRLPQVLVRPAVPVRRGARRRSFPGIARCASDFGGAQRLVKRSVREGVDLPVRPDVEPPVGREQCLEMVEAGHGLGRAAAGED
jgi:hypothetical protein